MDGNLENWLKIMKYPGEIPDNLKSVCNSSISYIWDQLVANTKPREDVEVMRRNIIINRLKLKPLNNQNEFPFPIPEIEVYNKKLHLQEKIKHLKKVVEEKRAKVQKLSRANKIKYITIERSKAKVKENCEREYLLAKRCDILKENISRAKEALANVRSLTPIEVEENPNVEETTDILRQASEKITELLKKMPNKSDKRSCSQKFVSRSARKPSTSTTFQEYLLRSETKLKSVISVRNENTFFSVNNKENYNNIKKCLFATPGQHLDSNKMNVFGKENIPQISKNNRRESLEILSNCDLNSSDHPLLNLNTTNMSSAMSVWKETDDNEFKLNDRDMFLAVERLDHHSTMLTDKSRESIGDPIEVLHENKILNDLLLGLLHKHDRHFIFNTVRSLEENLHMDILKLLSTATLLSNQKFVGDDIAKLRLTHIQIEVETKKQNRMLKKITNLINERKNMIVKSVLKSDLPKEHLDEKLRILEQHLEDVALDATLSAMRKEAQKGQNIPENNNLLAVSKKIIQLKEETATTIESIDHYIKMAHKLFGKMKRTREATCSIAHTLMPFTSDLSWCSVLTQNVWTKENQSFDRFPLNYNKRFKQSISDCPTHYRDVYDNSFPLEAELDDDHLFILTEILESPYSPPETIVLDILKSKMKLNVMQNVKTDENIPCLKKYSFKELQQQESYIQFAMDRLCSLLNSSSSLRTLSCVDVSRKMVQIWLQMPFKNYIRPTKLVKGADYKSYEKRYDSFYNNI